MRFVAQSCVLVHRCRKVWTAKSNLVGPNGGGISRAEWVMELVRIGSSEQAETLGVERQNERVF